MTVTPNYFYICHFHIEIPHNMHLVYPQIFCITIVFDYSWNDCKIEEKLETMAIQNFGGVNRVHYGLCENGEQGNTVEH